MYTAKKQLIIVYSSLGIGWLLLMFAIFTLILSGCTKEVLGGSGNVITEKRQSGNFSDVVVKGNFIVKLQESDTTRIEVSTDDNFMRVVETNVVGTTLYIKLKDGVRLVQAKSILVTLKSPIYHSITYSGNGNDGEGSIYNTDTLHTDHFSYTVNSNNNATILVKTPKLDFFLNGNGHIDVRGSADNYHCEVNGNPDINGTELATADASITLNGSGKHSINILHTLNAVINGSAKIQYLGDPVVHSDIQGTGSVEKY